MRKSKHLPFWFITIAVFIGLPGFTLIQDGMFMDAMLYTCVAHNEAHGLGSFWFPWFSKQNLNLFPNAHSFHEQPPFAFWFESLFFRLFGDSMYVERFYVFFCACVMAFLIHYLWRLIFKENDTLKKYSWLPILLWITIPTIYWSASNNVNENTMGLFTLTAVILIYKCLVEEKGNWWKIFVASVCVFFATLSKGFPGFFPICVPFLYWLSTKKISLKTAIIYSCILVAVPVGTYWVLFQFPVSHDSLSIYLFKRVFVRIASVPTVHNRFDSLFNLFCDLIPQIILLVIVFGIAKLKKVQYQWIVNPKLILFFALVGLAGSVPLMLTMVQKQFYMIPCYPFWGIVGALIFMPFVVRLINNMNIGEMGFRIFKGISILLLCSAITLVIMLKGKTGRDEIQLHDIRIVSTFIPQHGDLTVTHFAFGFEWELQCYLMRYYYISCEYNDAAKPNQYFIIDKHEKPDRDLSNYQLMNIGLQRYNLYKLK